MSKSKEKIELKTFDIAVVGDAYLNKDFYATYHGKIDCLNTYGDYCFADDAMRIIQSLNELIERLQEKIHER